MYKHEIVQLSRLIRCLLRSASRLLFCNEEVLRLSLIPPVVVRTATAARSRDRWMRERRRVRLNVLNHSSRLCAHCSVVSSQSKMLFHLMFTSLGYTTTCNEKIHLKIS